VYRRGSSVCMVACKLQVQQVLLFSTVAPNSLSSNSWNFDVVVNSGSP
jgi:hypothetical protein